MDFREFMQGEGAQAFLDPSGNPLKTMIGAGRLLMSFAPLADALFEDCWSACQDAQVIIGASLLPGCHIAEKLGVPCFQVAFYPFSRTCEFPIPLLPLKRDLSPFLNQLTYLLV
jgi:hypothetical protein